MARFALDATPLQTGSGGIRRYTEQLVLALAREFPNDEFWLLAAAPLRLASELPNLRTGWPHHPIAGKKWWSFGLPWKLRQGRFDLFHGTDFSVPYLPWVPAVMTIHDLSPWIPPWREATSKRVQRRTPWLLRLGLVQAVITPTEAIRKELLARFRLPPGRVVAIPLAAADIFQPEPQARLAEPYFLLLQGTSPRKNLAVVFDAWLEVRRRHPLSLKVAGVGPPPVGLPASSATWLGQVPDSELARLYRGAVALLYPSAYEGFGLPVLEAMQCGTPVIASDLPAIREVAGEAAILLDPHDARAWASAMLALLESPERRREWASRSLARARLFSWARTARMTRELYQEVLDRRGR